MEELDISPCLLFTKRGAYIERTRLAKSHWAQLGNTPQQEPLGNKTNPNYNLQEICNKTNPNCKFQGD